MNYSDKTRQFLDKLELDHPLIQAPMIGVSNPELATAVAASGALGSLGLGDGSPAVIERTMATLKSLTNRPVNLNFFCHATPTRDASKEARWLQRLVPLFTALNTSPPAALSPPYGSFDDNPDTLSALLDQRPAVVSFHFGLPKAKTVQALRAQGTAILACATSVAEAQWLEAQGADMIIAQGWEAGGHRGRFLRTARDEQLGTLSLVPQLVNNVTLPVIAAGGINSGATAAAALTLGAAAVQIGTAFVTCPESSAGSAYRDTLTDGNRQTLMTPVFSGRAARGLENWVTGELHAHASETPDYPLSYDAGKALAAAATASGDAKTIQDYSPMWAGQSYRDNRVAPAAALVTLFVNELQQAMN